jgi:Ni,Fe-hydrogenase I large subunit
MYRLIDQKKLIPYSIVRVEHELTKTVNDFIEEVEVEEVYFKSKYYNNTTKKLFDVCYKTTGYYAHKKDYKNEDFSKEIFISKSELSSVLSPILEESKKLFVENQRKEK